MAVPKSFIPTSADAIGRDYRIEIIVINGVINMETPQMLSKFLKLYQSGQRFVVFDVETVGHSPNIIVEIGAIEAGLQFSNNFRTFQKILQFRPPSWSPYKFELAIHKIPTQEIEEGEDRATVLKEFLQFIEGSTLISHTKFDIRAMLHNLQLIPEFSEMMQWAIWKEALDSCKLARHICPSLKKYSLPFLAEHFQIENPQAHRALADAYTTKRVLAKLLQEYQSKKISP